MSMLLVSLFLAAWAGIGQSDPAPAKRAQPQPINLYVFTVTAVPAGRAAESDESDLKERIEATRDITTWLKEKRKKS